MLCDHFKTSVGCIKCNSVSKIKILKSKYIDVLVFWKDRTATLALLHVSKKTDKHMNIFRPMFGHLGYRK